MPPLRYAPQLKDNFTKNPLYFSSSESNLRQAHSIQKIFAVFSKMVDAPMSPTAASASASGCGIKFVDSQVSPTLSNKLTDTPISPTCGGSKLDDFARLSQEVQKEGWLELKISEVRPKKT